MSFKPKLAAVAIAAATLLPGAAVLSAGNAQASTNDYFAALASQGTVVWDYPGMLTQGQGVCQLLYKDINPIAWLTYWVGYDTYTASTIIIAAQYGLCPSNAVTA